MLWEIEMLCSAAWQCEGIWDGMRGVHVRVGRVISLLSVRVNGERDDESAEFSLGRGWGW